MPQVQDASPVGLLKDTEGHQKSMPFLECTFISHVGNTLFITQSGTFRIDMNKNFIIDKDDKDDDNAYAVMHMHKLANLSFETIFNKT